MRRRDLLGLAAAASPAALGGCVGRIGAAPDAPLPPPATDPASLPPDHFDYIVVGSGAGGGPLAANLALAGYKVLLLEAGGEEEPLDVQVPAFHALSTEDPALRWSFYVRHYADEAQQRRDPKFVAAAGGVLYPRASTLGGCTAHNAMILVCPHNSDWDAIATLTGDPSWAAGAMRLYFERLERCTYIAPPPIGADPARHGYDGWLTTSLADPWLLARDPALLRLVAATVVESAATYGSTLPAFVERLKMRLQGFFDPNDWRLLQQSFEGVTCTPQTTVGGRRTGARDRVRFAQTVRPEHLVLRTGALATRVLLDDERRAVGIEYLAGRHLYRADPAASRRGASMPTPSAAYARREVILAGGAFNTPQLLMLSGIGPRDELATHGIPVRVDLPGVGRNLQDRYEVGVVSRMRDEFRLLQGASFQPPGPGERPDPVFRQWLRGEGAYTSNGAVVASIERSAASRPEPDLYLFGLAGRFRGYYPGYSREVEPDHRHFTWSVLKAHTNNQAGRVRLRSADPCQPPLIDFHYFDEGSPGGGEDLDSVVEGVLRARRIMRRVSGLVAEEVLPGPAIASRQALRRFVRDHAWGHHASCSCRIGPENDPTAVLDRHLKVRGTEGLRVVDASIFPRIPGFFIASAVYMASEKASDLILNDARSTAPAAVL